MWDSALQGVTSGRHVARTALALGIGVAITWFMVWMYLKAPADEIHSRKVLVVDSVSKAPVTHAEIFVPPTGKRAATDRHGIAVVPVPPRFNLNDLEVVRAGYRKSAAAPNDFVPQLSVDHVLFVEFHAEDLQRDEP